MAERTEEKFVRELFNEQFGVMLRKVPESKKFKTPDFELVVDSRCEAVLEVKLLERTPRTTENGWTLTESGFLTADDNGPSRIS